MRREREDERSAGVSSRRLLQSSSYLGGYEKNARDLSTSLRESAAVGLIEREKKKMRRKEKESFHEDVEKETKKEKETTTGLSLHSDDEED